MIDFSVLEKPISNAFDNDLIDIGRKTTITLPNGFDIETDPNEPIYTDVKCSIEYTQTDNPDINNEPTKPVIMSLKIYAASDIDVKNGDYITAKKCKIGGEVLEEYKGIAGEPIQYQSRTEFVVGVRKNV